LAAEKQTIPSLQLFLKALAAEAAKIPPKEKLLPWNK